MLTMVAKHNRRTYSCFDFQFNALTQREIGFLVQTNTNNFGMRTIRLVNLRKSYVRLKLMKQKHHETNKQLIELNKSTITNKRQCVYYFGANENTINLCERKPRSPSKLCSTTIKIEPRVLIGSLSHDIISDVPCQAYRVTQQLRMFR